ncbi:MAG: hypothetical protein ACRDHM_04845 [Actinomycetota bacterium]
MSEGISAATARTADPGALPLQRSAGRIWGIAASGLGGGLFAGVLAGGGFPLEVDGLATVIEATSGAVVLSLGAVGLAFKLGRRILLSPIARWGLAILALAGGFLVGFHMGPGVADDGPDDLSTFLEPGTGLIGLVLLALTLLLALVLSIGRYRQPANGERDPTLEEMVYGRRLTR